MKVEKVPVTCPVCGHVQIEPSTGYSTVCKHCRQHYRVQEALNPTVRPAPPARETRQVTCFGCDTVLTVPAIAQSTSCKRCGHYVDLTDYCIAKATGKNFRTKGRILIEKEGFLFNTDTIAGDIIVKGRLLGRVTAERSLEVYSSASIQGSFRAARLVVPAGNVFRWPYPIAVETAEIAGELIANLSARSKVLLKSTARFFGDVQACNLVVKRGAVLVGGVRVGRDLP